MAFDAQKTAGMDGPSPRTPTIGEHTSLQTWIARTFLQAAALHPGLVYLVSAFHGFTAFRDATHVAPSRCASLYAHGSGSSHLPGLRVKTSYH
jgi:hypothetical protein